MDKDSPMNNDILLFSLVRFQPDMHRQEIINLGVVLFLPDGPRISLAPNQGKLLALDPNIRLATVYGQVSRLQVALTSMWEQKASVEELVRMFETGGNLSISTTGMLDRTQRRLEEIVDELFRDLVSAPVRRRIREVQTSRLHTELRREFQRAGILGNKPSDISKHLVVPNFPIDTDVGLFAEFALRNGQLHVTETVDFRTSTVSAKRQEAQAKTLLLVQALERVGRGDLRRYVVVTGATAGVQASMNLLQRHADDLIVRESTEDWSRYVDAMHRASKADGVQLQ